MERHVALALLAFVVLVAKQAATLDVFSKGRVILGLGAGWAEKEFGFLNADFSKRGRVFDESIRLMKALWSDDVVNFDGQFFHIENALFLPKPPNRDIPVWIGGNGPTAVKRASSVGDGWHPVGPSLDEFSAGVEKLKMSGRKLTVSVRMTTDVRKRREPYNSATGERRSIASGSAAEIRKTIEEFEEEGLGYYCASILHPSAADIVADLKKFAAEVIRSYV
jgi:alkanesulfonate monooxygenase SsuD/methylene tetrahydromethanopterin reductase-like flavin-dependent oxidoreductase (luciferase family)